MADEPDENHPLIQLNIRIALSIGADQGVGATPRVPGSLLVNDLIQQLQPTLESMYPGRAWIMVSTAGLVSPESSIQEIWESVGRPAELHLFIVPQESLPVPSPDTSEGEAFDEEEVELTTHGPGTPAPAAPAPPVTGAPAPGAMPQDHSEEQPRKKVRAPALPKPKFEAPPAPQAAPAPAPKSRAGAGWAVGRVVREFKKGAAGMEEDDDIDYELGAAHGPIFRRATVRYFYRMNPQRTYPLLVILSAAQIKEIVRKSVTQTESEAFEVDPTAGIEIEPVLPGCQCYPPKETLPVTDEPVSTTFWVVPHVLGSIRGAKVIVRQNGKILSEVPLEAKVVKQTAAYIAGLLSLVMPYVTEAAKSHRLDLASQKEDGFPIYAMLRNWIADYLKPEWIGLSLLALAVVLYLWMRPRKREVFWDVEKKE